MELNKYDSHASLLANPDFEEDVSSSVSSTADMIFACDINAPFTHNDAHGSNKNPCDLEGNQSCLRTWKHLAHLIQNAEQAMHAPTLGKRTIEDKGIDEIEQACKRMQTLDGDHYILADAVVQPRQSQ
nr:hypothetical protein CFP56_30446 [Quercus suber]